MSAATKGSFSEDEFGKRMDRCLTDVLVKSTNGIALGTLLSSICFRQRRWPAILLCGMGAGLAFANCENILHAGGLAIGAVVSVLFLKRRAWPIILGTGFGIGVAYRNCEKDLNK